MECFRHWSALGCDVKDFPYQTQQCWQPQLGFKEHKWGGVISPSLTLFVDFTKHRQLDKP